MNCCVTDLSLFLIFFWLKKIISKKNLKSFYLAIPFVPKIILKYFQKILKLNGKG